MRLPSILLALPLLVVAVPAAAQDEQTPGAEEEAQAAIVSAGGISISGEAMLLSDYRYRGISRSDEDPAAQASLTVSTSGGLYAGVRGTTLRAIEDFGDVQLDLYAGYGRQLGLGTSIDVGLLYYYFPDGAGETDYFEPYASVSHTLGPVEASLGAKYAWSQDALGGEDILYLFGEVEAAIPLTPVTVTAQAGRQEAGALGSYWNWSLGARYAFGPAYVGARYVDTDLPALPGQDAGLVFSLGFRF